MSAASPPTYPVNLFYSYAHEDEALRDELRGHLKILERRGLLASWHDREIKAGEDWHARIDRQLGMADLVLLLVSKDFIASDYIFGTELTVAMQRHEAGLATVAPVIVRAIDIDPEDREALPFLRLQGLPTDLRPVTSWPNRDEAWTNVAKGLRTTVKAIHEKKAATTSAQPKRGPTRTTPETPSVRPDSAASDPLLDEVISAFTAQVEDANLRRGGGHADVLALKQQALGLIDEPEEKRVLWVDDHPENNASEIAALAKLQIEVQTARSTEEALRALSEDPGGFHVVISDWSRSWEWQAGLRLLQALRKQGMTLPVVYYHGQFEPERRAALAAKVTEAGAVGEAVYPAELFVLLRRALSR